MLKHLLGGGHQHLVPDPRRRGGLVEEQEDEEDEELAPQARIALERSARRQEDDGPINWRMVENISFGVCGVLAGIIGAAFFLHRRARAPAPAARYSRVALQDEEMQVVEGIVVDASVFENSQAVPQSTD